MYTWIWVFFLLYSWKIETLFPKLEYQKTDNAASNVGKAPDTLTKDDILVAIVNSI